MKDNSKKLLITQQEMTLIKNSNEVKDMELYGNMYSCIEDYKNYRRLSWTIMQSLIKRHELYC